MKKLQWRQKEERDSITEFHYKISTEKKRIIIKRNTKRYVCLFVCLFVTPQETLDTTRTS